MRCTRVAVTYSPAVRSSIMQIHMHERCTYNSLSAARVTNAWRFAGSICQLAEKKGRGMKGTGARVGKEREITGEATNFRWLASLKFLYIFPRPRRGRKSSGLILSRLNLFQLDYLFRPRPPRGSLEKFTRLYLEMRDEATRFQPSANRGLFFSRRLPCVRRSKCNNVASRFCTVRLRTIM